MKAALQVVLAGVFLCSCNSNTETAQETQLTLPVVEVTVEDVVTEKDFIGQVYGKVDIPIRARVEGFLEGIHFDEGRKVKKGQLLYTIDSQPFMASVAEAKSKLAEAQITLVKAENDLARIQPLADINAVSKADLDAAIAEKGAAEASVEAAKANVQMAEINLSYTALESPISGLIGKTQAKVGEFVGREPNPVILNTVSKIDTMRVDFFITENDYLRLARGMMNNTDTTKKANREGYKLKLILGDGSVYEELGEVDFIDRGVEESTGSILIQSSFPNSKKLIRPGQFAKVRAIMDQVKNGVLVPQRCVQEFQGNHFVWKVDESGIVEQQLIEIKSDYKDYFLIETGLKAGDQLVFEGIQQLKSGMQINTSDTVFQSQYTE